MQHNLRNVKAKLAQKYPSFKLVTRVLDLNMACLKLFAC
jgi:hypothetical protein